MTIEEKLKYAEITKCNSIIVLEQGIREEAFFIKYDSIKKEVIFLNPTGVSQFGIETKNITNQSEKDKILKEIKKIDGTTATLLLNEIKDVIFD